MTEARVGRLAVEPRVAWPEWYERTWSQSAPQNSTPYRKYQPYMGVSKNRGTPKWMVKIMENPIKIDDLGGFPIFLETPI